MKRIIIMAFLTALITTGLIAQNEQDALRYSYLQHGGTTRSISMGGAFGALGGDLSSLSTNPAGLGIFRSGELSFTPVFSGTQSTSSFLGNKYTDNHYDMSLSHFGFAMPLKLRSSSSGLKSLNFGFSYNTLRDFGQNITMQGVNNQNSLVDEFVYTANNNSEWDPFSDGLAWETWLIDYDSIANLYYSDFDVSGYGQKQIRTVDARGKVSEYALSTSANLNDKVFIGATMGIQRARYSEIWEHTELDPDNVIDFFEGFTYRNQLETYGTGLNFKLGFIAKPFEFIRIGGAVHTPTFYDFDDTFVASMSTDLDDGQETHTYDAYGDFDYEITTPFRAIGSLAFVLNKIGLISIDYEFVDYAQARLRSVDYNFFDENQAVSTRYQATNNLRIGGEYHFMNYFFRGGYALYQSPYVDGEANAGKNLTILSAGLGYRTKNFYVDLGFSRGNWDQVYYLYGNTSADLESSQTRLSATIRFRF